MGENIKLIANNKKAYHDYFIEDKYEAGIALSNRDVKLRLRKSAVDLGLKWEKQGWGLLNVKRLLEL